MIGTKEPNTLFSSYENDYTDLALTPVLMNKVGACYRFMIVIHLDARVMGFLSHQPF